MKDKKILTLTALVGLALAGSAQAQVVIDFTNDSLTFDGSVGIDEDTPFYSVGSLSDGTPTESDPGNMLSRAEPTGSLSGVDNADSFGFFYDTYAGSELTGNDLEATDVGDSQMASNSTGVASADGDINGSDGRGIFFEFDLSSLSSPLQITGASSAHNSGSGGELQIVVGSSTLDGSTLTGSNLAVYNLGGLSGSDLSIDVNNGDYVYFRNAGTDSIRLSSLTVDAVPEPSAFALLAGCFGLTWIMVRRR